MPQIKGARDFAGVLGANLIVNISTFVVLMAASHYLEIAEFAELSKCMALVVVGSVLLDCGLNLTIIKQSASDDGRSACAMLATKAWMALASTIAILLAVSGLISALWGVAICAAAMQNLWGGMRAADQANMNYQSIWRASALLSFARLIFAAPALASGSWSIVAIALWIAPNLVLALSSRNIFVGMGTITTYASLRQMWGYSMIVYISALAFGALPYLPQAFIDARLTSSEVGTFGLVLIGLGPIGLIFASARAYLLPRLMREDAFGRIRKDVIIAGAILFLLSIIMAHYLLAYMYGSKFPQLANVFIIITSFFTLTLMVGLYTIKIHAIGTPHLELAVNLTRLLCLLIALTAFGSSLVAIAWIFGIILLCGEVILAFSLWRAAR